MLCHPETNTNNFFITAAQDYIISYCKPASTDASGRGAVHISHILSGKCVARLSKSTHAESSAGDGDDESPSGPLAESARDRLGDVTAIHFSEERNELNVGSRQGVLHVWSQ